MTGLTTHVLDTALGKPAEGLKIDLFRLDGEIRRHLKTVETTPTAGLMAALSSLAKIFGPAPMNWSSTPAII